MPEISLITATYGRTKELLKLLNSLVNQTFKDFELIIVDQNEHDEVRKIVNQFNNLLDINYIHSSRKGLSFNRNLGLAHARGSIYGFPDDDCYYDNSILNIVHNSFIKESIKFICFSIYDSNNEDFCFRLVPPGYFKRKNIFEYCISYNFFIVANAVRFDERLGIGGEFGSGEETDYLYENISTKDIGKASLEGKIYHPYFSPEKRNYEKLYKYSCGFGAICKKDLKRKFGVNTMFLFWKYVLRAFMGIIVKKDKKAYILSLKGRLSGFFKYTEK